MNLVERVKAPTPKFFKVLRNIGLTLATIGGVILTARLQFAGLVTIAGYVALAGGVLTALVIRLTTKMQEIPKMKILKQSVRNVYAGTFGEYIIVGFQQFIS